MTDWVGNTESRRQRVDPWPVAALSALFDLAAPAAEEGDPLPPMWHWLYFLPAARRSETGPDGHPLRGGFLPPLPQQRRMFAGGTTVFHRPLLVGEDARQRATVKSVVRKEGRSGPLVLVTVEYRIWGEERPVLTENQNLIYTDAPPSDPPEPPAQPGPPSRPWRQEVTTDPVLMFRFSALTNNSHRIHYDHSYATGVEGYPGLVFQGPLTALLLADLARRNGVVEPSRFSFRAYSPFFCGDALHLRGGPDPQADDGLWTVGAYSPEGRLGVEAKLSA
ncbi:MAG: MaoC family dehydratase N-terminal domain-containing protein [Actinomycetia bacterium]|nr:MaoC family dehydratase N-terminal domain-containing protein [Actinomycetes bacterium]